jgi:hypothetical protein
MKKTHQTISILSVCTLLFLCQACIISGIREEDIATDYLTETTKNYVVFKIGSRWIYKQEGQNKIDTNTVTKDRLSILSGGQDKYNKTESHQREVYSTFYKDTYTAGASANIATFSFYGEVFVSKYFGTKDLFFNGHAGKDTVKVGYLYEPTMGSITKYVAYYPSYQIEGKTYQEVMVFECNVASVENPSYVDVRVPYKVYFAKNIGAIRREMKSGEIWNLIHHEVKQ